ncbi:LysR family transcriptional regulator [Prosthecobacter sp.]|uniref:LysR family transcriptional regulator n=1 Tax=Prosthecobacter sp. TaxID=1965333 RepID=UPI001D6A1188|nr:LysR family transcriptional regulator [Prosthecobacter sp.]MCB1276158.1 LysR family transcriptional regulator [Prosthecobacter sp.]
MNVHHLELFYYVARHGGVSAAARAMPYGIQQPAISAQILQLEDALGVTLYQRRPFQLTREGQTLYEFIAPFFSGLVEMADRLRGGGETRLRIATAEVVQRDYLPELLIRMRRRVKGFQFTLTHGRQQEIEALLASQEIDIGLSTLMDKTAANIEARELMRLPMVLLVPKQSGFTKASQILEKDRIDLPLVMLDAKDVLSRAFQAGLRQRGADWIPSLEVGSLDLVVRYVAEGFGAGLALNHPRADLPANVKVLTLEDFPPLSFGALWTGRLSPLGEAFLAEATSLAGELTP